MGREGGGGRCCLEGLWLVGKKGWPIFKLRTAQRTLSGWRPGDVVGRASWNELAESGMDDRIARWACTGGLRIGVCYGGKARDQLSGSEVHGGGLQLQ
jgi:hypothetical protein